MQKGKKEKAKSDADATTVKSERLRSDEIKTDQPLSEKDEVKQAEEEMRKRSNGK